MLTIFVVGANYNYDTIWTELDSNQEKGTSVFF